MNRARVLTLLTLILRIIAYGVCLAIGLEARFYFLPVLPLLVDIACFVEREYKLYD